MADVSRVAFPVGPVAQTLPLKEKDTRMAAAVLGGCHLRKQVESVGDKLHSFVAQAAVQNKHRTGRAQPVALHARLG